MPIPADNTPWLPAPWDFAYKAFAENEAWWLGDTDALQKLYQGPAGVATHHRRGTPMQGGVVGKASRFFWGRPVPANEQRARIHVPAAADLATLASDLVFAEPPQVRLEGTNTAGQDRLDLIANSDGAHQTFQHMGEVKSALGAAVLVTRWDTEVEDHTWLEASGADVIIPVFRHGRMVEVTLWTEYLVGQTYYRHLEHHAPGYIEHALFAGTGTNLGRRVPLTEHPETAMFANLVNGDSVIETGIKRLTATYNPNLPTAAWRKKGQLAATGRSDFAQLHGLFDWLDEAFSSWMRDLRNGGGRLVVPDAMLTMSRNGDGASFDPMREIYSGLTMPAADDNGKPVQLTQVQFQIRVAEHEQTIARIYKEILRKAGMSQASFGDYVEGGAVTATEVSDRKSASERTRDKKLLNDRTAIARQASVALELDGLLFPGKGGGLYDVPLVEFEDTSQEDPLQLAQTLGLLDAASAISIETMVRRLNPEWEDQQVGEEVAKIKAEKGIGQVLDPATFTGTPEESGDPLTAREQFDALGLAVRAGVKPESAAKLIGIQGVQFTGDKPVSLRPANQPTAPPIPAPPAE